MPIPIDQIVWVVAGGVLTLVLVAAIAFWTINYARRRESSAQDANGEQTPPGGK